MTTGIDASGPRKRGSIRRMGACLQVRVSAGEDPSTGGRIVLVESVPIEKPGSERSERAAMKDAERARTRLLAEADSLKVARTKSTVGALLDRWLPQHEVDPTTRMNYESQIRNYIKPNLGVSLAWRRLAQRRTLRHRLVAIRYSQVRSEARPSNPARPCQALSSVSWSASSAFWKDPSIR